MKKKLLYIVGGIACFVVAGGITFGILSIAHPVAKKADTTNAATASPDASTSAIVAAFVKLAPSAKPLDTMAVQETPITTDTPFVYVKSADMGKYVGITGSKAAAIKSTLPFDQPTITAVDATVDNFMQSQGYRKQTDFQLNDIQATYVSKTDTCSLGGVVGMLQFTLVCNSQSNSTTTLATVTAELNLWPDHASASYETATQRIATSGDGAYSVGVLTLYSQQGVLIDHSLLYTKHGDSWVYVTDMLGQPGSTSNGKVVKNDATAAVQSDEHYGPLLNEITGSVNSRS